MGQSSIDGELSSKPCLITGGMHDMEIDVDTMNPIPPMIDTPFLWSQICRNPLPMNSERCLIHIYIHIYWFIGGKGLLYSISTCRHLTRQTGLKRLIARRHPFLDAVQDASRAAVSWLTEGDGDVGLSLTRKHQDLTEIYKYQRIYLRFILIFVNIIKI